MCWFQFHVCPFSTERFAPKRNSQHHMSEESTCALRCPRNDGLCTSRDGIKVSGERASANAAPTDICVCVRVCMCVCVCYVCVCGVYPPLLRQINWIPLYSLRDVTGIIDLGCIGKLHGRRVRLDGGDGPRLDPVRVPRTLSEKTNFDRVIGLIWSVGQGGGGRGGGGGVSCTVIHRMHCIVHKHRILYSSASGDRGCCFAAGSSVTLVDTL